MDAQNRLDNQNAFAALAKQGIKTISPDAAQREEWTRVGKEAAQNFATRGKIDSAVSDKIYRLLKEYRAAQ